MGGRAGQEHRTPVVRAKKGGVQEHKHADPPSREGPGRRRLRNSPSPRPMPTSVKPPAATPPSSIPGGPCPVEPKLCAEKESTHSPTARPPSSGWGSTRRTGSESARTAPVRSLFLARRSPRRAWAEPTAGHCGKGVEDAAGDPPQRRGGEGGVGLG